MAGPATKLDYLEMTSPKLEETQAFLAEAFGWSFVRYGNDYRAIEGAGLDGGIARGERVPPLPVLKTDDLKGAFATVRAAGAEITRDIYAFPGGRRFEFVEPGGTKMAVWGE